MPSETIIDAISLSFSAIPWWLAVLLGLASVAASIWYYRDTIPPVEGTLRIALTVIRALGLFLIVAGIAEPVLRITSTVPRTSVTAVLFDTSSSMNTGSDPTRNVEARRALDTLRNRLPGPATFHGFDTAVRPFEDSPPPFTGNGTDISSALSTVSRQSDVSGVILISDGQWNLGGDPAATVRSFDLPVHTVTAGNRDVAADVVITGISASPVGRDGTSLPVEITVASSIASDSPVPVAIVEDGTTVVSGEIALAGATSARILLDVPLDGIGVHRFSAVIDPADDINAANNTRDFTVNTLKNRFAVLIVAAEPSPDLAFLRRIVDSDSSFTLDIAVGGGAQNDGLTGSVPESLTGYDGIILIDGGGELLNAAAASRIRDRVEHGCGLWMLGSTPPGPGGATLEQALPFRYSGADVPNDTLYAVIPTETGHAHFVTAESADTRGAWNNLPPVSSIIPVSLDDRNGAVLAEAFLTGNRTFSLPAIIAGTIGSGKVLAIPFSGIWRWSLAMAGAGRDDGFFSRFVTGAMNWLTAETDTAPLTVSTGSQSYLSGQAVQFEARLFDNVYTPVAGAEITLEIDDAPSTRTILEESTPAVYTADIQNPGPGEHTYRAIAYRDRREFATATGTFTVQDFSLEMLAAGADPSLMASVSALSGGIAVTPAGIDSIIASIEPAITSERRTAEHLPAFNPLLPFAALVLLSLEWIIRKRRGML